MTHLMIIFIRFDYQSPKGGLGLILKMFPCSVSSHLKWKMAMGTQPS